MNVTRGERLQAPRPDQPTHSLPVENPRPADIIILADGLTPPAIAREAAMPGHWLRGRLIVIGFVVAAPVAVGGWLWLLGRVAFALL